MKIAVVGGGSWGSAFAALLAEHGHETLLACRDPEQARAIAETGRNPRYLTELDLAGVAGGHARRPGARRRGDCSSIAVPSRSFREVVAALPGNAPVVSLVKGLDPESGDRLSTVVEGRPVAVLSGPNHAEEIALGLPAAAVIACEDMELGKRLQEEIHTPRFRVYVNTDVVGVELCAAAKNVIALGAGAVDGLGMGDNAKAGLLTRGLARWCAWARRPAPGRRRSPASPAWATSWSRAGAATAATAARAS